MFLLCLQKLLAKSSADFLAWDVTGSKTQSCPRLKMLLKLLLCFAHLFHVLIPSLAFKAKDVSVAGKVCQA